MTTFSWKRKIGENISKETSLNFSAESEVEVSFDDKWIKSHKRRKVDQEANRKAKAETHKNQGIELAQQNKLQEAVSEFDKALSLLPKNEKLHEMKAQALLQQSHPFPAVQSAERAVKLNPCWWVAYQTLGRSQLGIGDLKMAKISFSKAIHINPTEQELWEEDLKWTLELIEKESKLNIEKEEEVTEDSSNLIFDEEGFIVSENPT
ncbi:tetratricopeptide repeat protein 33 [Parasteatoda tepidariorum]|uniref:Tetratricopeptide repeat protein 33-like n=1 Tax=Parasteatoda tepidariorum TaxID=114398 RepID=A0A2L2YKU6_PARTP|nr:tetratricopeptide repeat protein 33 [Parasteatoda tepidariorum]